MNNPLDIPGFAAMLKRASVGSLMAASLVGGGFALADEGWNTFPTATASDVVGPGAAVGSGLYGLGELGVAAAAKRRRRVQRAQTAAMKRHVNEMKRYSDAMRDLGVKLQKRLREVDLLREAESLEELMDLHGADASPQGQAYISRIFDQTREFLDKTHVDLMQGEYPQPAERSNFLKRLNMNPPRDP